VESYTEDIQNATEFLNADDIVKYRTYIPDSNIHMEAHEFLMNFRRKYLPELNSCSICNNLTPPGYGVCLSCSEE
jgi:hypothetical protein